MSETEVIARTRMEFLWILDVMHGLRVKSDAEDDTAGRQHSFPTHSPLFVGLDSEDAPESEYENYRIAAREAFRLGEIEYLDSGHPNGPMVCITEKGREYVRKNYQEIRALITLNAGKGHDA